MNIVGVKINRLSVQRSGEIIVSDVSDQPKVCVMDVGMVPR